MSLLGLFDYPKAIRQLRDQIPQGERDDFIKSYKKLPEREKTSFKEYLKNADTTAASKILGKDLTIYNVGTNKLVDTKKTKTLTVKSEKMSGASSLTAANGDIVNRVNRILSVPTSIDPELVAEQARRYEEAVPLNSKAAVRIYKEANVQSAGKNLK